MKKKKYDYNFILILVFLLFILGLFTLFIDLSSNNNNINDSKIITKNEIKNKNISEDKIINKDLSLENKESYQGDLHLQIGLSDKDLLKIYLNNNEVFNSNSNKDYGVFQIQVFEKKFKGENTIKVEYKDNNDDQPLVIFVIKDGVETIHSWEPKDSEGTDSFKINLE